MRMNKETESKSKSTADDSDHTKTHEPSRVVRPPLRTVALQRSVSAVCVPVLLVLICVCCVCRCPPSHSECIEVCSDESASSF
ncbi:hypothetical protein EVAR_88761_1 [Eumeta japonica]|uniref:Uncharacterized protein n=1 Tax=Eumeta variegata TaxID=151549 RepID=A0A4C1XW09_EUMVA|nr:hypothetical protein EVAR_88761_1 [Eumeta japonica]